MIARDVNFVWNYCNDTAVQYLDKKGKWITEFDLNNLTTGCSQDLSITSRTIHRITRQYVGSRLKAKKRKLAWRSRKSLGWVPFHEESIKVVGDVARYKGVHFRFWHSRQIEGVIKTGSFSQDAKGNWFVNFCCEVEKPCPVKDSRVVAIDLGLKTLATLSDGSKIDRDNITNRFAERLGKSQRAKKKKQVRNIHQKISNCRKDFAHKVTTKLVNNHGTIFVGNVSPSRLKKTRMAKSVSDAGWYDFKSMLAYKAIALGVEYKEINESFSTVTCSTCFKRTGPSGLSALGVREWTCPCGATHDRDVNAAKNILRFGHETLLKESHKESMSNLTMETLTHNL